VVFEKLVEILVFGCAYYWRIADEGCSESTLRRRRRDEWIELGLMERLRDISAFSDVVIIVRRLIREGWRRYRWEERPSRCP
jgi:hypothetical protein